jgi:hypothetical protein
MLTDKEAIILAATAAGAKSRVCGGRRRTSDALMSRGLLTLIMVPAEGGIEAHYAATEAGLAVLDALTDSGRLHRLPIELKGTAE